MNFKVQGRVVINEKYPISATDALFSANQAGMVRKKIPTGNPWMKYRNSKVKYLRFLWVEMAGCCIFIVFCIVCFRHRLVEHLGHSPRRSFLWLRSGFVGFDAMLGYGNSTLSGLVEMAILIYGSVIPSGFCNGNPEGMTLP